MTTSPRRDASMLTDEMLARFDERAPGLRPREPLLRRGLRGAARRPATCCAAVPDRARRRRARPRRVLQLQSPARLRRAGHRAGRQHALLLDRRRRRPAAAPGDDSCRFILEKAAEGEVFAALHGEAGNDMPAAAVVRHGRAGRRRLGDQRATRSSAASRRCGPTAASTPWTRPTRQHPQIVHGFLPRGHRRARRSSTRGTRSACGRRRARTRCSTRRSCPTSSCPLVCPAGFAGAGPFHVGDLRLGADGLRRRLPRRGQAGVRPHRRADAAAARRSR